MKDFQFGEGGGILTVKHFLWVLSLSFTEYFGFLDFHLECQHLHESLKPS